MTFDISRSTFDAWNDYLGVVMQQGRVHLDSDWNELLAEFTRRIHAGALDIVGLSGAPSTSPGAFQIALTPADSNGLVHMTVGVGRMYVNGILVENRGSKSAAVWDPTLGGLSGLPFTSTDYTGQPYVHGATLPTSGVYLVYLDVWRRDVSYLEDGGLIDQAVGVDTTGRLQTVWQVKLLDVSAVAGGFAGSSPDGAIWSANPPSASGLVWQTLVQGSPSLLTNAPAAGYTGQENQLYRVEIHQGGSAASGPSPVTFAQGMATFKWSRENASVATAVTAIAAATNSLNKPASQLKVASLGRDQALGFSPGDWIEITDDYLELNGASAQPGNASSRLPGEIHQIDSINVAASTIMLDAAVTAANFPLTSGLTDPTRHTRIRRWDQSGTVYLSDGQSVWLNLAGSGNTGIPVPPSGMSVLLENGVSVAFDLASGAGAFQTGDYWTFAARTADGSVAQLTRAEPAGVNHHVCRLAILDFSKSPPVTDCRTVFPPLSNPAIHVTHVSPTSGAQLIDGGTLSVQDLSKGLDIFFDSPIDPGIVTGNSAPACFITVYVPDSGGGWLNPVMLKGTAPPPSWQGVVVNPQKPLSITWTPDPAVQTALIPHISPPNSVLARLTLKGDSIWAANSSPPIYLNGSALPDGRAFADFERWFWINSQPPVELSANSLNCGTQTVGSSSPQFSVALTNNSPGPLTFTSSSFTLGGANMADFGVTNTCGTGIAAGQNCTINIVFHPTSSGQSPVSQPPRTANLNITAGANPPLTIALTGVALAPWLSANPGSVNFGQAILGQTASALVVITNVGNASLTISDISIVASAILAGNASAPQDFAQTNTLPATRFLLPNQSFTFTIRFTPSAAGGRAASLQINNNATTAPALISLTGNGVQQTKSVVKDTKDAGDNKRATEGKLIRDSKAGRLEAHPALVSNAVAFSRSAPSFAEGSAALRSFITPDERPMVGASSFVADDSARPNSI